jgi:hypothetical protein
MNHIHISSLESDSSHTQARIQSVLLKLANSQDSRALPGRRRIRDSVVAMLQVTTRSVTDKRRLVQVEKIREHMLNLLGLKPTTVRLRQRVMHASDAYCLWYLRSDLLRVLGNDVGEANAREKMLPLTAMFTGLLLKSLTQQRGLSQPNG